MSGNAATFSGGIGVSGTATFTGPATASNLTVSGLLKAPQLRITGTDPTNNTGIENVLGSPVAFFYNDYRCDLSGNTSVLGNLCGSGTPYVAGPATCNQTLAVTGNATVGGNLTTSGARSVVASNVANTQSDGYSSIYLNTPLGIGQLYSGQNGGLNLTTTTAHPIRLNANRFAAGALNSIEI